MKYHTAGVLEKALSYLIFILLVLPIAALIFVLCGLFRSAARGRSSASSAAAASGSACG